MTSYADSRADLTANRRAQGAVGWASTEMIRWLRAQAIAAGKSADLVPDEEFRILRFTEVKRRTGMSSSNIYRRIAAGDFPAPIRLGGPCQAQRQNAA